MEFALCISCMGHIIWDYTDTMSEYKIVEGLPQRVEMEVSNLLKLGWVLNGELFSRKTDGNTIVVQGMVKPSVSKTPIFVFHVRAHNTLDPNTIVNAVTYTKCTSSSRAGGLMFPFNYIIKMRGETVDTATEEIKAEIALQRIGVVSSRSASIEYIQTDYIYG